MLGVVNGLISKDSTSSPTTSSNLTHIIDLALERGEVPEAKVHIQRLGDDETQLYYYTLLKDWKRAMPLAQNLKDYVTLTAISKYGEEEPLRNRALRQLAVIEKGEVKPWCPFSRGGDGDGTSGSGGGGHTPLMPNIASGITVGISNHMKKAPKPVNELLSKMKGWELPKQSS